jgi:hypothetical protein
MDKIFKNFIAVFAVLILLSLGLALYSSELQHTKNRGAACAEFLTDGQKMNEQEDDIFYAWIKSLQTKYGLVDDEMICSEFIDM